MHRRMDGAFEDENEMMCKLAKLESLDEFWKKFSEIVEKTWLEHMEVDKDTAKKLKGRGEAKLNIAKPKPGRRLKRRRA